MSGEEHHRWIIDQREPNVNANRLLWVPSRSLVGLAKRRLWVLFVFLQNDGNWWSDLCSVWLNLYSLPLDPWATESFNQIYFFSPMMTLLSNDHRINFWRSSKLPLWTVACPFYWSCIPIPRTWGPKHSSLMSWLTLPGDEVICPAITGVHHCSYWELPWRLCHIHPAKYLLIKSAPGRLPKGLANPETLGIVWLCAVTSCVHPLCGTLCALTPFHLPLFIYACFASGHFCFHYSVNYYIVVFSYKCDLYEYSSISNVF